MTLVQHDAGARLLARPRLLAALCVAVLAGAGWISLGLMLADSGVLAALCRPSFGAGSWNTAQAALVFAMWCAMVFAMMLPSAAPMILTYADLAETAARKGEPAASPLALIAGYLAVWLSAAVALSALQVLLVRLALVDPALAAVGPLFSGAIFIGAGVYQFSALKRACVTQCRHPFRFFFANWTDEAGGIFRLGVRQGLYCVGCCWAMMLLMFAVGAMNVVWMAVLGALMTVEKLAATMRFSRALGGLFILVGVAFIATSIVAHWPVRAG
jgi:predicted metal-binding membrane protein